MQPTAVSRNKFKNGYRQKQDTTGKCKKEMLKRRVTLKRERSFPNIVKFKKTAKKSGPTMSSTTTYPNRIEKVLRTVTINTDKETGE